ncbi:SulP family inorganic anion transporter [Galactobacter valiniphilus]|uniref:SulP family inorganic anion transporter n=1 Tax=Galactobacter valiniphilus TaxID=2676122 RepID=UPI0037354EA6
MAAGLTLTAISVPLNIGYAQIAGLPPEAGLQALVVPTLLYALLASSRQVVASPDAAAAALVFSSIVGLGIGGEDFAAVAAAQAMLCGAILLAAGFLRWGFLANFLSHPVLTGFVAGLALEVLLSQAVKMLGLRLDSDGGFFPEALELIASIGQAHPLSVIVAGASLTVLLFGRRMAPAVPWALIVLVLSTLAVALGGLEAKGVAVLGSVEVGLSMPQWPHLSLGTWLALIPSALALAMVAMAEGVVVSTSYAQRHGYTTDPNRDLVALGAGNAAAGLVGSFAMGPSTSRTAAMDQAGSRTQIPSLVTVAVTSALLLFGTGLLTSIPSPAIGAVVAVAVIKLLDVAEFRWLARHARAEFLIACVCLLGVLVAGPLQGLGVAFLCCLVDLMRRSARPEVEMLAATGEGTALLSTAAAGTLTAPGVAVVRFAAPVYFANAAVLENGLSEVRRRDPAPAWVVLDMEAVTDVDSTGGAALARAEAGLAAAGQGLAFSRVRPELAAALERLGVGRDVRRFASNRDAVEQLRTDRGRLRP